MTRRQLYSWVDLPGEGSRCVVFWAAVFWVDDFRRGFIFDRELDGITYGECYLDSDHYYFAQSSDRPSLRIEGKPHEAIQQCFCLRMTGQDDQQNSVAIMIEGAGDNCFHRIGYAELHRPFPRRPLGILIKQQIRRRTYYAAPCAWETLTLL